MYCLIDETGAIAKRTSSSTAEWRGLTISNLAALSPEDRRATGVYLQLPATVHPGEFERAMGAEYDIDHATGTVQERFIIEPLPAVEVAVIQRARLEAAVQDHLNSVAANRGYGTARTEPIVMACSYTGTANQFQAESNAFVVWRSNVWAKCYEVLAAVESGTRTVPTEVELIAELPVFA